MNRITIVAAAATLVPSIATAHPDHFSQGSYGIAHYLTDPFHVLVAVAAVSLILGVWRSARRLLSLDRRPR